MFHDRTDAALQLAQRMRGRTLHEPLVLAIPRGGVVTGAVLARELNAELDIVLSRKLRAPYQPELAIGAISEDGLVYMNPDVQHVLDIPAEYLTQECRHQRAEIARRKSLFRNGRPAAPVAGRSVIITDDGIATGSTMIAALQVIKAKGPQEVIVAVPVVSPRQLRELGRLCDEVVYLLAPSEFRAVGQFYQHFTQVEDQEVIDIIRQAASAPRVPAES